MFIIDKISRLSPRSKEPLYKIVFNVLVILLFFLLILSIIKTDKLSYIRISPSNNSPYTDEPLTNVSNFNNGSITSSEDITTYINEIFSTRNSSFLNGSVENLYKYYNLGNKNSKLSLNYEFKRIAYTRDWLIQRGAILTAINTAINIKDIHYVGNNITLKVDEASKFKYIYSDNNSENIFEVKLIHIIALQKNNESYSIEKDYYLDFLGDEVNSYKFSLKESTIPYSKSVNNNFAINNTFTSGDILCYYKFNYIDHKAVISGFDSHGYPIINSTTINCTNLPYDLGWKEKNIRLD